MPTSGPKEQCKQEIKENIIDMKGNWKYSKRKSYKKGINDKRKGNKMRNMMWEQGFSSMDEDYQTEKKWK